MDEDRGFFVSEKKLQLGLGTRYETYYLPFLVFIYVCPVKFINLNIIGAQNDQNNIFQMGLLT